MRASVKVLFGLLALLGLVVVAAALTLKPYRAPSSSMLPNLKVNSRFAVFKLGYDPHVGDVAVLHPPRSARDLHSPCPDRHPRDEMCMAANDELDTSVTFVERVVAGPGDRVSMRGGRITRNGRAESGYALAPCAAGGGCDFPGEVVVPDGHWLVLGDNRGASDDSRFWGTVPADAFVGRKLFKYWPPGG